MCGGIYRLHSRTKDLPHCLPSSLSSSSLKTVTLSHVLEIFCALRLPAEQRLISELQRVRVSGAMIRAVGLPLLVISLVIFAVGQAGIKEPGAARFVAFSESTSPSSGSECN